MNTGTISRMKKSLSLVKCQGSNVKGSSTGFTLLELLIVIAIIAILSVALILVINPAETLRKSRDAQRISDLSTVKTALALMLTSTSTPSLDGTFSATTPVACLSTGGGTANTSAKIRYSSVTSPTHVSVAAGTDAIATGAFLSPGVGTAAASAGNVDGTGWIPTNLGALLGGSPISNFPIDPTNTVGAAALSTDLVYRYGCQNGGGSAGKPGFIFEIDAQLESIAYTVDDDKRLKDGGDHSTLFEVGTNLKLLPTGTSF